MAASSSGGLPAALPASLPSEDAGSPLAAANSPSAVPKSPSALAVAIGLMSEFDAVELELAQKVENGELRMEDALLKRRLHQLGASDGLGFGRGIYGADGLRRPHQRDNSDEVRINRATEGMLEAYRRLTRPEKAGKIWSLTRWGLVSKLFAKLRGLAGVAAWELPIPACNASRDPQCLAETGIDDHSKAGDSIDETEGEVDARVIRVAARLVMESQNPTKEKQSNWSLTQEAHTLTRLVLINLRNTGAAIERLLEESESKESAFLEIKEAYGALAANLACLRQRLGEEMTATLEAKQETLWSAATAACNLGLARERSPAVRPAKSKSPSRPGSAYKPALRKKKPQGDPFMPLHQATLLMNLSSLAQVSTPRGDDDADSILAKLTGEGAGGPNESASSKGHDDTEDAKWNIEFTASQLRLMQKSVKNRQPQVQGAQQLLRDTLDCYERCAEAMSAAYSDEKALRANPAEITQHRALLSLVRELQSLWRDAGAVLGASRQADLLALESVRKHNERIVLRAFRVGGLEVATVVLARLALVDEMLEEPGHRQLTGELPWELIKPYQLVEAIVHHVGDGCAARDPRRRRRWLRCPHASVHSVLAGEVWRQLLVRFLTIEAAFEPLLACKDCPLTFREFRMALCLLEIQVSERIAAMLFEAAADASGTEATLKGLLDIVHRYGPTSSGDKGVAAEAANVAARALAAGSSCDGLAACTPIDGPTAENSRAPSKRVSEKRSSSKQAHQSVGRRASLNNNLRKSILAAPAPVSISGADAGRGSGATGASALEKASAALENLPHGAPMVCIRCLKGDVPVLPHTSVQELNRQTAVSRGSGDAGRRATRRRSSLLLRDVSAEPSTNRVRLGSASDSDEDIGEDMEAEWQGFGEDAIVSWATSVLAQGVLLCKDERGIYFKWLARIVLYGFRKDEEGGVVAASAGAASGIGKKVSTIEPEGSKESAKDLVKDVNRRRSLMQSSGSDRRTSVASDAPAATSAPEGVGGGAVSFAKRNSATDPAMRKRSATITTMTSQHSLGGSDSARKRSMMPSSEDPDRENELARQQANALTKEAAEEWEEAIREVSLALPENILNVIRIDLGLSQLSRGDKMGFDPGDTRPSMFQGMNASALYSDFTDVITKAGPGSAHRAKRAAREIRIIVGLRHLNVPESELQYLQRELHSVAESHAHQVNGMMLVAGAARAAQTILVHRTGSAKPAPAKSGSSGKPSDSGSPSNKMATVPSKRAQDVISSSSKHTMRCYERSGFEPLAHRVAVALRFLENELFSSDAPVHSSGFAAISATGEEAGEMVVDVAPLLLPTASSERILDQVRKEEEEEEKARRAADKASNASPMDMKGAPPLQLKTIVRVKSIDSQNDSPSSSPADTPRVLRPSSPLSQATGSSGSPRSRPRSRSSGHPHKRHSSQCSGDSGSLRSTGSKSRRHTGSAREVKKKPSSPVARTTEVVSRSLVSTAGANFFPAIGSSPAPISAGNAALEDFNGPMTRDDLTDWPPSVQQLFQSVDAGRSWIKRTVRPGMRGSKGGRTAGAQLVAAQMLRSYSAPDMLPQVLSGSRSGYGSVPYSSVNSTSSYGKSWPRGKVVSEVVQCGRPRQ